MTTDHALTWQQAMKRARQLNPVRIAAAITESAETGLRAARFDANGGGRTTRVPCPESEYRTCRDGGPEPHSHLVTSDPTGNAVVRGSKGDTSIDALRVLNRNTLEFVTHAAVVLDFVVGESPDTWQGVMTVNARLMPGTVQAGLDVDAERLLPYRIDMVDRASRVVSALAEEHLPRDPSMDEKHWDDKLYNDNSVCAWHLAIHRRYRRPRVSGLNICQDCVALSTLLGQKPPQWLIEAQVDFEGRPMAWRAALSRCMDELGVVREAG